MNDSYTNDSIVINTKNMLMDYGETFNETDSEFVSDSVNNTTLSESEDYDVKTYLESILGPQRQPSEKVSQTFLFMHLTGFFVQNIKMLYTFAKWNKSFCFCFFFSAHSFNDNLCCDGNNRHYWECISLLGDSSHSLHAICNKLLPLLAGCFRSTHFAFR